MIRPRLPGNWALPLSWLYGTAVGVRNWTFDHGLRRLDRLDRPVVSVGNLTVGGGGKTPLTMALAQGLTDRGLRIAVLSRGYGGKFKGRALLVSDRTGVRADARRAGDEAVLLARRLPGIPVAVAPRRWHAGRLVAALGPIDCFLLDDGFQHRRLVRTVDLCLIRADETDGGGPEATAPPRPRLLPVGPLRESLRGLRRADAVLLTRVRDPEATAPYREMVRQRRPDVPIFCAGYRPVAYHTILDGKAVPLDYLKGKRAGSFCGLYDNESFIRQLAALEVERVFHEHYADHHGYTQSQVERLIKKARRQDCDFLITSEKDAVKLAKLDIRYFPILSLRMEAFLHDEAEFYRLLLARITDPERRSTAV